MNSDTPQYTLLAFVADTLIDSAAEAYPGGASAFFGTGSTAGDRSSVGPGIMPEGPKERISNLKLSIALPSLVEAAKLDLEATCKEANKLAASLKEVRRSVDNYGPAASLTGMAFAVGLDPFPSVMEPFLRDATAACAQVSAAAAVTERCIARTVAFYGYTPAEMKKTTFAEFLQPFHQLTSALDKVLMEKAIQADAAKAKQSKKNRSDQPRKLK